MEILVDRGLLLGLRRAVRLRAVGSLALCLVLGPGGHADRIDTRPPAGSAGGRDPQATRLPERLLELDLLRRDVRRAAVRREGDLHLRRRLAGAVELLRRLALGLDGELDGARTGNRLRL